MASPESPIPKIEIKRRRVSSDSLFSRLSNVVLDEFVGDFGWIVLLVFSVLATVGLIWLLGKFFA